MDVEKKKRFMNQWERYFNNAPLPIAGFYTDKESEPIRTKAPKGHRCVIADIVRVLNGKATVFDRDSIGCFGGKK